MLVQRYKVHRLLKLDHRIWYYYFGFTVQITDIQKKMGEVKSILEESCLLAEKLVGEKLGKQKYIDQEKSLQSRIDRLLQEVNTAVQTL